MGFDHLKSDHCGLDMVTTRGKLGEGKFWG